MYLCQSVGNINNTLNFIVKYRIIYIRYMTKFIRYRYNICETSGSDSGIRYLKTSGFDISSIVAGRQLGPKSKTDGPQVRLGQNLVRQYIPIVWSGRPIADQGGLIIRSQLKPKMSYAPNHSRRMSQASNSFILIIKIASQLM